MKEKICAVCAKKNIVNDSVIVNKFMTPNTNGAKEYFNLWHFPIEKCEACGYSSRDISECQNFNVKYLSNNEYDKILKTLNDARPNSIRAYIDASRYYALIGDQKSQALCLLQAGDGVYNEIIYWQEYILTENEDCVDLKDFGNKLYDQGTEILKSYTNKNSDDIDMQILLIGLLSETKDKSIGFALLQQLKKLDLSNRQREMLDFLEGEFY